MRDALDQDQPSGPGVSVTRSLLAVAFEITVLCLTQHAPDRASWLPSDSQDRLSNKGPVHVPLLHLPQ